MATHGQARLDTIKALENRKPFDRRGSRGFGMWAIEGASTHTGRLDVFWSAEYRKDVEGPGVKYTVLSYATPIAWVTGEGTVVIPAQSHSVTTTHHQTLCRTYL